MRGKWFTFDKFRCSLYCRRKKAVTEFSFFTEVFSTELAVTRTFFSRHKYPLRLNNTQAEYEALIAAYS